MEACTAGSEYGPTKVELDTENLLFHGLTYTQTVLMSHTDYVSVLPPGFRAIAATEACPAAAIADDSRRLYGVQFHPEAETSPNGTAVIRNFLFNICSADGDYRDGNRIVDATVMATAVFGLVTLAPSLASFGFVGYGWIAFFTSAQILALVAIATRMALMWQMARIANFANDTKGLTERHATAGERAEERARVDRLFDNAKTAGATAGSPSDGRAFSDDIDKV